jgi:RimJ/RimL family protein N-acetyltransferase
MANLQPVLETDRLVLYRLTKADAIHMFDLMNTEGWLQFIGDRGIRTKADAERYLAEKLMPAYTSVGFGFYAVREKISGCFTGICGLVKRDSLTDVDLGFAFLDAYKKRGYGFESAKGVMQYAHETLKQERLLAIVQPDNQASIGLLEKLGFQFERIVKMPMGDEEIMLWGINISNSEIV